MAGPGVEPGFRTRRFLSKFRFPPVGGSALDLRHHQVTRSIDYE